MVDSVSGEVYLSLEVYYFVDSLVLQEVDYTLDDFNVNIITPNNDGINDLLDFSEYMLKELCFTVFNRWGDVVFEMKEGNQIWDGMNSNGYKLTDGTYFYVLSAQGIDNNVVKKQGFIELAN